MEWYYQQDDTRVGPVSDPDFDRAVAAGAVMSETLVWNERMPDWQPYSAIDHAPTALSLPDIPPPYTPAAAPVVSDTAGGDSVVCRECGTVESRGVMIPFEDRWVCVSCKDLFFQKIKEGVALEQSERRWEPTGGATSNSEIAAGARDCLRGKVMNSYGVLIVYGLCQFYRGIPSMSWLLQIFLAPPFVVGFARYFLNLAEGEDDEELVNIFGGFSKYGTSLGAVFLRGVLMYGAMILSLIILGWVSGMSPGLEGFLFVGVGISAVIFIFFWHSYFFLEYVIASDEELGVVDSLRRSWNLISGKRFKLFLLTARYFFIPCLFALAGIGSLLALAFDNFSDFDSGFVLLIGIVCIFYLWMFLLLPFYFTAVAIFFKDIHQPGGDEPW